MFTSTHEVRRHELKSGANRVNIRRGGEVLQCNNLLLITLEPLDPSGSLPSDEHHYYVFGLNERVGDELAGNLQFVDAVFDPSCSRFQTVWKDGRYPQRIIRVNPGTDGRPC